MDLFGEVTIMSKGKVKASKKNAANVEGYSPFGCIAMIKQEKMAKELPVRIAIEIHRRRAEKKGLTTSQ